MSTVKVGTEWDEKNDTRPALTICFGQIGCMRIDCEQYFLDASVSARLGREDFNKLSYLLDYAIHLLEILELMSFYVISIHVINHAYITLFIFV